MTRVSHSTSPPDHVHLISCHFIFTLFSFSLVRMLVLLHAHAHARALVTLSAGLRVPPLPSQPLANRVVIFS